MGWMNSGRIQGYLLLPTCCPTVTSNGESLWLPDTIRNEKVTARLFPSEAPVPGVLLFC